MFRLAGFRLRVYLLDTLNVEPSFEAEAFHPSLGGKTIQGTLTPEQYFLKFAAETCTMELTYSDLWLELSQRQDRVFFKHRDFPEWVISTTEMELIEHRAIAGRTDLRHQINRYQQRRAYKIAAIVTVLFVLLFAAAFYGVVWAGKKSMRFVVSKVPVSWETNFGNALLEDYKKENLLVQNPELEAKLAAAFNPLTNNRTPIPFLLHLQEDQDPNAFAMPGGHIVVSTGLFELVEKPEELSGVLAHEMAHVLERHGFRKAITSAGPWVAARLLFGDSGGLIGFLGDSSTILLQQSYSRSYEREADERGWDLMVKANINPRAMIDFLKKMKVHTELSGLADLEISALSSHPPTPERIQRLEAKWKKLERKTGFRDLTVNQPAENP